jgi:large subunit ribosomal protein L30
VSPRRARAGAGPTGASRDSGAGAQGGDGTGAALRVTQVRSATGTKPKHRGTLRALGLRGVGRSRVLPDRPEIRGMIARVPHLLSVRPARADELDAERRRRLEARAAKRASQGAGGHGGREEDRP